MTIRELARQLNVSPATVSLALNDKKGVSEETRRRIKEYARACNYNPSSKASRSILFLKYYKHGMLVEENAGFITSVMDAIELACKELDYDLQIKVYHNKLIRNLAEVDLGNYAGVIVLGTELDPTEYKELKQIGKPYIVVDNAMPHCDCFSVTIDNFELVYKALTFIRSLGHTDLIYFASKISTQNFKERNQAVYHYAEKIGLKIIQEISLTPTMQGAYTDMLAVLRHKKLQGPVAFADNDVIAIGAIKALKESGYSIPKDLGVVGFDNVIYSQIMSPSLTTVAVPRQEMGLAAVNLLDNMIEGKLEFAQRVRVDGCLQIRESCC